MFKKKYTYQYYGSFFEDGKRYEFSGSFNSDASYKAAYDLTQRDYPTGNIKIFTQNKV